MTEERMSLTDHLDELRRRAILCLLAVVAGMIAAYSFYNPWILNLLRAPLDCLAGRENPFVVDNPLVRLLKASSPESANLSLDLHFIGPMEVFMVKIKSSFFAGAILASPLICYQVWKFISAALKETERKVVGIFAPASLILFACGVAIAYFIMLPVILYFLVVVSGAGLVPTLILSKYTSMVVLCCMAFGVVFEMPLVILFLVRLGIVTPQFLAAKRKYAILAMFVISAILTPPDIVTQVMMALPMIFLYEVSILLARMAWVRKRRSLDE